MKKKEFEPFPISLIGSLPRNKQVLDAKKKYSNSEISKKKFDDNIRYETKKLVDLQEKAGVDIITSGELIRDNYISFIAENVSGFRKMTNDEIISFTDEQNRENLEASLIKRNTHTANLSNPICNGKIDTNATFEVESMKMLKDLTKLPIKATIPSPYLLTRTTWLTGITDKFYESREKLGQDIVELIYNEIDRLIDLGVDVIQLDDPILAEVVLADDEEESFFCGRLSERIRYDHELVFAMSLIKPILDKLTASQSYGCLHVCRGNFTKNEESLLNGSYASLSDFFAIVQPDALTLEFSTPRAGDIKDLFINEFLSSQTILGLGVVNPRSEAVETSDFVIGKVEQAMKYLRPENIWLNPDCGFATFEQRPMNSERIIFDKIKTMKEAQKILRSRL